MRIQALPVCQPGDVRDAGRMVVPGCYDDGVEVLIEVRMRKVRRVAVLTAVDVTKAAVPLLPDVSVEVCTAHFEPTFVTLRTSVLYCVTASTAVFAAVS